MRHLTLVETCPSLLPERLLEQRCSSRRVTLRVRGRVWPPIPCGVNAENVEAGVTSRSMTH